MGHTAIQRFQILEVLGRGGMGTVYRAYDPQLQRDVAIKVLVGDHVPAELSTHQTIDLRQTSSPPHDGLIAEARMMALLSHPNVLPIYEVGLDGGSVFLVMEYVAGSNLLDWLATRRPELAPILDVFVQAGEGLAAAHARGIVHRDFKPENVLVGIDGRVRVGDFGLSNVVQRGPIRVADPRGTPEFMAPELWRGEPATVRSDVFAFCRALGECVAEHRIAQALRAVIRAGLEEDPARRPELRQVLEQLRTRPRSRRWIAAALAGGVLAAAGVAGVLVLTSRADRAPACEADASIFAGRWDPERRAAMTAFLQPSQAPATVALTQRVIAILDDYAREIGTAQTDVCTATERGELTEAQAAMRSSCLERRAFELGAVARRILADKWDLAAAEERAQSPSGVASCSELAAAPIRDRAAASALHARHQAVSQLPVARRAEAYSAIERDASALGETELEVRAALALGLQLRDGDQIKAAGEALDRAYKRSLDIRASALGAIALVERANLAARYGDPTRAETTSKLALALADKPGMSPRTRVRIYGALGRAAFEAGNSQEAVGRLETALELIARHELKLGWVELDIRFTLTRALSNLEGRNRDALAIARATVEIAQRTAGESSANYATALNMLALSLRLSGDLDASLQYRRKAVQILTAALPPDHSRVISTRADLAADLEAAGYHEEARRESAVALEQCDRNEAMAVNRPVLRAQLALSTWGVGKLDAAVELLEQAILESTSQYGKDHVKSLYWTTVLVDMELELGRLASAARHIAALEQSYQAHPQPRDTRLAMLRGTLATQLAIARGKPKAGEALARKALAELAERKIESGRGAISANLGGSLLAQHRWADAKAALDMALAVATQRKAGADSLAILELRIAQAEYGIGQRAPAIERARHARDVLAGFPGQPKARAEAAAFLMRVDR